MNNHRMMWIFASLLMLVLATFNGCENDGPDDTWLYRIPVLTYEIMDTLDTSWQLKVYLTHYGDDAVLRVNDDIFSIEDWGMISIPRQSPIVLTMTTTEKNTIDTVYLPIFGESHQIQINNRLFIDGDTLDLPRTDTLVVEWNPFFPGEFTSCQRDSLMMAERYVSLYCEQDTFFVGDITEQDPQLARIEQFSDLLDSENYFSFYLVYFYWFGMEVYPNRYHSNGSSYYESGWRTFKYIKHARIVLHFVDS